MGERAQRRREEDDEEGGIPGGGTHIAAAGARGDEQPWARAALELQKIAPAGEDHAEDEDVEVRQRVVLEEDHADVVIAVDRPPLPRVPWSPVGAVVGER